MAAPGRRASGGSADARTGATGSRRASGAPSTGRRPGRPGGAGPARVRGTPRPGAARPAAAARGRSVAPAPPPEGRSWLRPAVVVTILVVLPVMLVPTLRSLLRQRAEIGALQEKVSQQERSVADLQAEQERWKDPAYVEQQARERLKFVRPGDRSYTVIDGTQPTGPPPGTTVAAPKADASAPWFGQIWQSIQLADRPTAGMAPVSSR